jgi:peptide/nickel transport system permease protein
MKPFTRALVGRPAALLSAIVLGVLYGAMLVAEFAAPYNPVKSWPEYGYHPPNLGIYSRELGLRLQVQRQEMINPVTFRYVRIRGEYAPVRFFVKGEPYRLFGLLPADRHLFGTERESPVPMFLFGTDNLGRDIFSRIIYGSRISLTIGFVGIFISLTLAIILGGIAGYYGGLTDSAIMRAAEFFMLIPGLYMILFLRSVLSRNMDSGQSFMIITVILSFVGWPGSARMIRGMVHSLKNEDYISNAKLEGIPSVWIIFRQIIPQISSLLIVSIALGIPGFILGETALSYLGLGIMDPAVSWGSLINRDITTLNNIKNFPWLLVPGYFLLAVTLAFNYLGDLLRDYYDPWYIIKKRRR